MDSFPWHVILILPRIEISVNIKEPLSLESIKAVFLLEGGFGLIT
jgi:hypothetical protein